MKKSLKIVLFIAACTLSTQALAQTQGQAFVGIGTEYIARNPDSSAISSGSVRAGYYVRDWLSIEGDYSQSYYGKADYTDSSRIKSENGGAFTVSAVANVLLLDAWTVSGKLGVGSARFDVTDRTRLKDGTDKLYKETTKFVALGLGSELYLTESDSIRFDYTMRLGTDKISKGDATSGFGFSYVRGF